MVNSDTSRAVLGYNPVSERVITLRVNAKPVNITFVQVYAPTGASSEEEITALYEQLPTRGIGQRMQRGCYSDHGGLECKDREIRV